MLALARKFGLKASRLSLEAGRFPNDPVRGKNASEAARAVKTDVQFSRIGVLAAARFTQPFPD